MSRILGVRIEIRTPKHTITGRKAALLLLGGPDNSHLLRDENDLYSRPSAKDSPVDEQISPMSLEDLTKRISGYR